MEGAESVEIGRMECDGKPKKVHNSIFLFDLPKFTRRGIGREGEGGIRVEKVRDEERNFRIDRDLISLESGRNGKFLRISALTRIEWKFPLG